MTEGEDGNDDPQRAGRAAASGRGRSLVNPFRLR